MLKLMSKGMSCPVDQIEVVDAEKFISIVIREKSDYTKWQREYFDRKSPKTSAGKPLDLNAAILITGKAKSYDEKKTPCRNHSLSPT